MIEDGTYQAVVVKNGGRWIDFARAGKKQTPKAVLSFRIVGGDFDGQGIQWDGWLTTPNAISRTRTSLERCGFHGSFASMGAQIPTSEPVEIVIEQEEYEGKRRAKVAFINGSGYQVREEDRMSARELGEIDARTANDDSFDGPGFDDKGDGLPNWDTK